MERAQSNEAPQVGSRDARRSRHSATVRVSHWLIAASVAGLLASGVAILLAHPRLYWGDAGAFGMPSLVDLPLPLVFGQTGWGRHLHFLSAWVFVAVGLVYVLVGLLSRHFGRDLLPARRELAPRALLEALGERLRTKPVAERELEPYNVLQRLAYLAVIFVVCPLMILTGLAMSPAFDSVQPLLPEVLGGRQSARTLHFVGASVLALFLLVHLAMLCRRGGLRRLRAMLGGRSAAGALR